MHVCVMHHNKKNI